jgi:hypothetical protein
VQDSGVKHIDMHPLLEKLSGGDRRSIGRSEEVVSVVLQQPVLFAVLIEGLSVDDSVVRMRAADAMQKVSLIHPECLLEHKKQLIQIAAQARQKEVRWHLAQVLPRLARHHRENIPIVDILTTYLQDNSSIVRTFVMQAYADIAERDETLRPSLVAKIQTLTHTGTKAMQARGRKLVARLSADR